MDYMISNVCADVDACNRMLDCMDAKREYALKVDAGRKSLATQGNRTCVSHVLVQFCMN